MNLGEWLSSVPRWEDSPWGKEFMKLNGKFQTGQIINATREELEHYLVVLANGGSSLKDPDIQAYMIVIRELIQLRVTKEAADKSSESNKKSRRIAWFAVVISALSLITTLGTAIFKKTVNNIPIPSVTVQAPSLITTNVITIVTTNKP